MLTCVGRGWNKVSAYNCNEAGEWDAAVAGERPQLAGGGGDCTYDAGGEDDDNDARHHVGGGVALGDVEKDLDEGVAGWGGDNVVDIAEGEAQRDDHQEAERAIHGDAGHDSSWQGFRGVFNLLRCWDRLGQSCPSLSSKTGGVVTYTCERRNRSQPSRQLFPTGRS